MSLAVHVVLEAWEIVEKKTHFVEFLLKTTLCEWCAQKVQFAVFKNVHITIKPKLMNRVDFLRQSQVK